MKVSIECYPCLLNQILATVDLLELAETEKKEVMDQALAVLADGSESLYPQEIVVQLNEYIMKKCRLQPGSFDPYRNIKKKSRKIALDFYASLKERIESAEKPVEFALKCAVLGNIIDYGAKAHGHLDVGAELEKMDALEFGIYDDQIFQVLPHCRRILYLGDNVGEDVFDKALIREIRNSYPNTEIIFATREQPIINDVTIEDAEAIAMNEVAQVISSGSIYPGTIMPRTTEKFQRLFKDADLVLAKGQGNFETLIDQPHVGLYFLLRAKCKKVAKALGVSQGSMVLRKQQRQR